MDNDTRIVDQLKSRLEAERVIGLEREELAALLRRAEIERQVETGLAGAIRVLRLDSESLLQEQTTRGQFLVRRLRSDGEAERLIASRLAAYERMWDG